MIRIATYPDPAHTNQYFARYYGALAGHGFTLVGRAEFDDDALRRRAGEFDVLHLHWGHENLWRCRGAGPVARARGVAGLWRGLRLARRLGKTVVWTAHDLESHDTRYAADRVGNVVLARMADLVVCHAAHTRDRLVRRYHGNPRTALVMPHGNYDGVYPPPRPRAEVLAGLGLDPARRTLVAVGLVRRYKGFDTAVEAVRRLGPDYQLVVAGLVWPDAAGAERAVRAAAAGLPNVRLIFRSLGDDEVADLHAAADCVLLPYRWITGSGALLTSLTLGRAVVASALPYFREVLAGDPAAGVLCPPGDPAALAAGVRAFFAADVPARHAAARRIADRVPWAEVVRPVAGRLHELRAAGLRGGGGGVNLSVIIPAYNREWSVGATIESVLRCGAPAEVVVVDDESTDRTADVARGYGPGVAVLRQPNAGPAGARNTGFRHSTGDVVAFLDSDDVWLPGVVPDCLAFLRAHPDVDVLVCEAVFGNPAGGYQPLSPVAGRGRFPGLLTDPAGPGFYRLPRHPFVRLMIERNQVFLGSTFIRRAALAGGGPFDPALFGGEDYELCLRLAATRAVAFHDRPLARYEKHPGGLSASPDRMAREFALAVRSMVRRPDLLTPPERAAARAKFSTLAFQYGYLAYDRGDYAEARRRFAAGVREGGVAGRSALYWLACCLPAPALRLLRRAKHLASGTTPPAGAAAGGVL